MRGAGRKSHSLLLGTVVETAVRATRGWTRVERGADIGTIKNAVCVLDDRYCLLGRHNKTRSPGASPSLLPLSLRRGRRTIRTVSVIQRHACSRTTGIDPITPTKQHITKKADPHTNRNRWMDT